MSEPQELNHYFVSAQKPTDGPSGEVNFVYKTFSADLDDSPQDVFEFVVDDLKQSLADKPGRYDNIQILAFNRI